MNSSHHEHSCCHPEDGKKKPWYLGLIPVVSAISLILLVLSFFFPAFIHFRHAFMDYLRMMLFPVLIGFLAGGLIDHFIPSEYISKVLTGHKKRTVLYAAGLGFLMSACSHGIIAISMELHKKGASGASVVSFLLASPWANLPITFLLVGFFGWKGLLIIFVSLLTSILTGWVMQVLDKTGKIEKNRHAVHVEKNFSIRADIAARIKKYRFSIQGLKKDMLGVWHGIQGLADMIMGWMLLGILMASLASAFIPPDLFMRFLGPSLSGLLITLLAAAVLEVCSEGTSPLAFEIYKNTGAFGNAFAFLMGGVVTDYTEVGLVWKNLGRRTALWMLGLTIPQVLFWGMLLNFLF